MEWLLSMHELSGLLNVPPTFVERSQEKNCVEILQALFDMKDLPPAARLVEEQHLHEKCQTNPLNGSINPVSSRKKRMRLCPQVNLGSPVLNHNLPGLPSNLTWKVSLAEGSRVLPIYYSTTRNVVLCFPQCNHPQGPQVCQGNTRKISGMCNTGLKVMFQPSQHVRLDVNFIPCLMIIPEVLDFPHAIGDVRSGKFWNSKGLIRSTPTTTSKSSSSSLGNASTVSFEPRTSWKLQECTRLRTGEKTRFKLIFLLFMQRNSDGFKLNNKSNAALAHVCTVVSFDCMGVSNFTRKISNERSGNAVAPKRTPKSKKFKTSNNSQSSLSSGGSSSSNSGSSSGEEEGEEEELRPS